MENSFCNSAVLLPLPLGIKVWSKWNVYSERHVAFLKKKILNEWNFRNFSQILNWLTLMFQRFIWIFFSNVMVRIFKGKKRNTYSRKIAIFGITDVKVSIDIFTINVYLFYISICLYSLYIYPRGEGTSPSPKQI